MFQSFNQAVFFTASNANSLEAEGFGRFAPPAEETDACRLDNEEEEGELLSEESDEFVTSAELRRNRVSSKGYILYTLRMSGLMSDNYMYYRTKHY